MFIRAKSIVNNVIFLLAVACLISITGCVKEQKSLSVEESGVITLSSEAIKSIGLTVTPIMLEELSFHLLYNGIVKEIPTKSSYVISPVNGRLLNVFADINQLVEKGGVLAEISSHDVAKLQLDTVEKQVDLEGEIEQAKLELRLAEKSYSREKELYNQGITAKKDFLEAEHRYERAQTKLDVLLKKKESITQVARKRLLILGAKLENATSQSGHLEVRAPLRGIILKRFGNPGEFISENSNLFQIGDLTEVFLESNIYEKDLAEIMLGQRISFYPQAFSNTSFTGDINYIGHVSNPDTRTIPIRVRIKNSDYRLKPEMFGKMYINLEAKEVLAVHKKAIQKVDGKHFVYVKVKNGFKETEVNIGREAGEFIEVLNGLKPNQKIVTEGSFWLRSKLHHV